MKRFVPKSNCNKGVTRDLIRFATKAGYDDLSRAVIEAAKGAPLNILGNCVGGRSGHMFEGKLAVCVRPVLARELRESGRMGRALEAQVIERFIAYAYPSEGFVPS